MVVNKLEITSPTLGSLTVMKLSNSHKMLGAGIIVAAIIISAVILYGESPPESTTLTESSTTNSSSLTSLTIDGIQCDGRERYDIHNHMHLDIFINGKEFIVPSGIGFIPDLCLYWLHTHDDDGVIHIESPYNRTFTLGELFHIWGENFSNSQLFEYRVGQSIDNSNTNLLSIYINGKKADARMDYRQIQLNAFDEIAIVYGNPPDLIPSMYDFGNNALFN